MSLTSHLADKTSPVHRFFAENFSDAGPARAALSPTDDIGVVAGRYDPGAAATRRSAWRLGDPQVVPPSESLSGYPWDTVGTAFDYRVRFFFSASEGDHRVAHAGASRLMDHWTSGFDVPPAFTDLERRVSELRHVESADRGEADFERDLGALCYALALYEQVFRMGGPDERQLLYRLGPLVDLDDILASASNTVLEDLAGLARHLVATQSALLASSITPNPSFAGSPYLGGADADLITGKRLLDVKVTTNPTIERTSLWQVLGYALGDVNDAYGIDEVGLYYARHGVQVVWPVDDLLSLMAGQPVDLRHARGDFGEVLRAAASHYG